MSFRTCKCLLLAGSLAAHSVSYAGSLDGLNILVIPSGPALARLGAIKAYFDTYRPGSRSANCGDGSLNIADARFATVAHKLPAELGTAAVRDTKQRKRLAKALESYRDKTHPRGFDAALIVDVDASQIRLTGISADPTGKPYKSTLRFSELEDPSQVQGALCRALGELPVLDSP
jgi:hypothetical protein